MLQKLLDSQRRAQIETIMLEGVMAYLRAMARHSTAGRLAVSYGEQEVLLRYNAYGLVGILLAYGGRKDLDQEKLVALFLKRDSRGVGIEVEIERGGGCRRQRPPLCFCLQGKTPPIYRGR